jgi:alginate O-acetyltransferase complex protein AlgI
MNYNTFNFLLIFLPLCLTVFYSVPASWRLIVLLVSSFIFYGTSGMVPLELLAITILWGYSLTLINSKKHKKFIFLLAVSAPLIILWLFKYLNFTLNILPENLNEVRYSFFSFFLSVSIPAGISFYTFQLLAYVIDVYYGRIPKEKNLIQFSTFVSFFPQLIAGPILRYKDLASQLTALTTKPKLDPDFISGCKFLVIGLFAKTFFSDALFLYHVKFNLANTHPSLDAVFSVLSYSFIIYYDFWSYSLMAIGLGKMFSINLPRNFLEPYISTSPREFWKRWHVTLSYWLRDYVYIPLKGNQFYTRNILIVFLAVGLWHGAGWNFIWWGAYHALLVITYHYTQPFWDKLPRRIQIGLTFILITLGWPLFYLDLESYLELMIHIFSMETSPSSVYSMFNWVHVLFIAVWTFWFREDRWLFNQETGKIINNPIFLGFVFVLCAMFLSFRRTFIYFQF